MDQAEDLYRRALAMKEKLLGPEHPDVAVTLNNLATLYRSQDRLEEAKGLYRRCLSIFKKALDPIHPSLIACTTNYSRLLRAAAGAKMAVVTTQSSVVRL
jgi:hypothetical protein